MNAQLFLNPDFRQCLGRLSDTFKDIDIRAVGKNPNKLALVFFSDLIPAERSSIVNASVPENMLRGVEIQGKKNRVVIEVGD